MATRNEQIEVEVVILDPEGFQFAPGWDAVANALRGLGFKITRRAPEPVTRDGLEGFSRVIVGRRNDPGPTTGD